MKDRITLHETDDAARFLARIDRSELHTDFYETVSENDDALHEICHDDQTIGLAEIYNGGSKGYLYIYIFAAYRNQGYGHEAARLAEFQMMSPELKSIVTSYHVKDETARQFALSLGYPGKYASAHMTYRGKKFELPDLPVRQYEDGDYDEAFALYAEAFHRMRLSTGCFPESVPKAPSEAGRKEWAESADERYVYLDKGEIVGYAHQEGAELGSISVKISRQGEGFGRNFVRYMVNVIMEKTAEMPSLWCVVGNHKARRLYDSLGFEEDFCQEFAEKTDFSRQEGETARGEEPGTDEG